GGKSPKWTFTGGLTSGNELFRLPSVPNERRKSMNCTRNNGNCNGWDIIDSNASEIYNKEKLCRFYDSLVEGIAENEVICNEAGQGIDFRIIRVNNNFGKITGIDTKNISGKTLREILPDIEEYWIKELSNAALNGLRIQMEEYCKPLKKYFRVNAFSMEKGRIYVLFTDVTKDKEVEALSEKYQLIKENARDTILFVREDGKIIEANKAAVESYGYTYEELLTMNISDIRCSDFDCLIPTDNKDEFSKGILFETIHKKKDGTTFYVEVSSKGTLFNGEYIVVEMVRDITDRKQTEERLQRLAYYDPVTDLPNKKYFSEYILESLDKAKQNNEMIAVLFIDLDRYKKVNDTMGHLIGDKLLKGAADRFKALVNESVFAARVGGDEFIIIQSHIKGPDEAADLAYRILTSIKEPFYFDGEEIRITTSIGISLYPMHGEDALTLMKNADMSMYRVKNSGRNNYEFYIPGINKEAYESIVIENSLHHALENNEFILHYQPKFNALTGKIIGMEALIRWKNPKLGLVPPGKFIDLAEETGLIVPIGKWVLKNACEHNKLWQELGFPPMRVAVNLSLRQFEDGNLVEIVKNILKETELDPKYLELEVTETMAMKNMDLIVKALRELKDMGIHIALDDFGTGYSSLKYLRNIPVDTLKIDRSFINDLNSNSSYVAIIDAIIDIAKKLSLGIIAEGVETLEQSKFLVEKKCFEMQGFLFSKPVSKDEFENMLLKYNLQDN
ncbi:diguanylate cyclase domain protein, partial [Clostridiales bacterium oral taxon 876 str. F0540]